MAQEPAGPPPLPGSSLGELLNRAAPRFQIYARVGRRRRRHTTSGCLALSGERPIIGAVQDAGVVRHINNPEGSVPLLRDEAVRSTDWPARKPVGPAALTIVPDLAQV